MHRKILAALLFSLIPLAWFCLAPPARASTTITVNSTSDVRADDGSCTLREAIIAANTDTPSGVAIGECPAGSGADTINLPAGTYTITIPGVYEDNSLTGDFDITQTVTIVGAGRMCGSPPNPQCTLIKGNSLDRVFDITNTIQVTISQMQIQGGNASGGWGGGGIRNYGGLTLNGILFDGNSSSAGGLWNAYGASAALDSVTFVNNISSGNAGAIYNKGTLTLTTVALAYDTAAYSGGGLYNDLDGIAKLTDVNIYYETAYRGGGIYHNAGSTLLLERVTLYHNSALNGNGAGLYISNSGGAANLTNVTISSNSALTTTSQGGGIFADAWSVVVLTNTTIYNNAASTGGGIYHDSTGGVIWPKNTIVYSNTTGNCAGGPYTSLGYNLEGADTCSFSATGDMTNTNPSLGSLASNGGFVQTHALLVGSPAINKIPFGTNGCGTTVTTDARAYARVAPCDIGAFEYVLRVFLPLILK